MERKIEIGECACCSEFIKYKSPLRNIIEGIKGEYYGRCCNEESVDMLFRRQLGIEEIEIIMCSKNDENTEERESIIPPGIYELTDINRKLQNISENVWKTFGKQEAACVDGIRVGRHRLSVATDELSLAFKLETSQDVVNSFELNERTMIY